jgi:hypothetical protein
MPNDINFDSTPESGLVLVDNGAPLASYNPNPLWVLICSVSPQDRSIVWIPGRVNIPRPFQPGELRSYSFNSFNGSMSWIPVANRRQANLDSSGNPIRDDTLEEDTSVASITSINDDTKGRKFITFTKNKDIVSVDASALSTAIASLNLKLSDIIVPRIGARINFKCNIMNQWGSVRLARTSVTNPSTGQFNLVFATLPSNDYGVQLSISNNKPAIIQYGNTTTKGVTIFTYNMRGEFETLDGDFTIEIL